MSLPVRALRSVRRDGVASSARRGAGRLIQTLKRVYGARIRPLLPSIGHPVCNGVVVARPRKLLDPLVPRSWVPEVIYEDLPLYESALVAAIQRDVRAGDRVVIVGGGYGVTLVAAARAAGRAGSIVCFEAVPKRLLDLEGAVHLNGVETPVRLERAIVGRAISLFGPGWNAPVVSPTDLPECDVLEMDCEGAEIEILSNLRIRPRLILVETHGSLGAPTAEVRRLLEGMAYAVEDRGAAEADAEEFCLDNDIRVLVACSTPAGPPAMGEPERSVAPDVGLNG